MPPFCSSLWRTAKCVSHTDLRHPTVLRGYSCQDSRNSEASAPDSAILFFDKQYMVRNVVTWAESPSLFFPFESGKAQLKLYFLSCLICRLNWNNGNYAEWDLYCLSSYELYWKMRWALNGRVPISGIHPSQFQTTVVELVKITQAFISRLTHSSSSLELINK